AYGHPAPGRSRARRLVDALRPGPGAGRTLLGMALVGAVLAGLLVALDGRSPYGAFPKRTSTPCGTRYADGSNSAYVQADGACETAIERGDTYGPAMDLAYVPGTAALGWSGRWDDLPAAHFTAGVFDLLAGLGLAVFGWRLGGRRLAVALALFWFAVPWTAYTFMSDSNDSVVAALLAWSAALVARPTGRGALLMLAVLAKFAPLLLIPLWLRLDRGGPALAPGEWAYGHPDPGRSRARRLVDALRPGPGAGRTLLGMALVVAVLAGLLVALDGPGALRMFWDRTFGWQLDRPSPFSIWNWGEYPGLPDLGLVQTALKGLVVGGAIAANTSTHGRYRYIQCVSTIWNPHSRAPARARARVGSSRRGTA
ncbi:MAG: hypothetical protein ACKOSO_03520, partial [Actinomycetota bacterium]